MISSKPYQYAKGWVEFYKLRFKVTPDVLIPRPETELLVDEVIAYAKQSNHPEERSSDEGSRSLTILDLGTGSGNIAISIAKNLSHLGGSLREASVTIIATDISSKALKVAEQNAKLHKVEDKITFIKSDLLSAFCHSGGQRPIESNKKDAIASLQHDNPNIIVTNLPYIPSARIPYLDSSVKDFEPHIALDGGKDGFDLYRKLFQQIKDKGLPAGRQGWKPKLIIGEIDYTHGELAVNEAQKYFPAAQIEVRKDLGHLQRILTIKHSTD